MIDLTIVRNPFAPLDRECLKLSPGDRLFDAIPDAGIPEGWALFVDGQQVSHFAELEDCDRVALAVAVPHGAETIAFAAKFIFAAAISFAASRIFAPPKPPRGRGDRKSPTYAFDGIESSRVEGLPIALIYGFHRIGIQVINEYVDVRGTGSGFETDLYTLGSLGEGPLYEIGGVQADVDGLTGDALPSGIKINGNSIENFDDVEVSLRMGSNSQSPVPGYHKLYTYSAVDQVLGADKSSNENNQDKLYVSPNDPDSPYNNDWDDEWTEHGVEFDITTEVDGFRARVRFPQGLWIGEDDGSLSEASCHLQFRYRELDGTDTPITTGGPNGDGWFRITPEVPVVSKNRSAFDVDFEHRFNDPQGTDWVPTTGKALVCPNNSSSDFGTIGFLTSPYSSGEYITQFTASCWVFLTQLPALPTAGDEIYFVSGYQDTARRGFDLFLRYETSFFGGPGWYLTFRVGGENSGSGERLVARDEAQPWATTLDQTKLNTWVLITGVYARREGQADQCRIYSDGTNWGDNLQDTVGSINFRLTTSTLATDIRVAHGYNSPPSGGVRTDVLVDDLVFLFTAAGQTKIANWVTSRATRANDEGAVCFFSFDDFAQGPAGTVDQEITNALNSGTKWFDDMGLGSANVTSGVATGVIGGQQDGTPKRMKARVGLLRLNYDSTNKAVFDDATFLDIAEMLDEELAYPNVAIYARKIRATEQISGEQPEDTLEVKGRLVPTWDGQSTTDPAIEYQYNANPAWVAMDIATHPRYGLGEQYGFLDIDLERFRALALHSNDVVYDGSLRRGPDYPGADGWSNMIFDADAVDPDTGATRGAFYILGWPGPLPEEYVADGRTYVRILDVTEPGSGTASFNMVEGLPGGYEIAEVGYNIDSKSSSWMVKVWWDRTGVPWTDDSDLDTELGAGDPDGYITTAEPRFEFNGVFDEETPAWDALMDVLAVARAAPVQNGNRLSVVFSEKLGANELAHFFIGRGSIVDGSFDIEYTGPEQKANAIEAEILDADEDFERNVWRVNSPDLTNAQQATTRDYRIESVSMFGVTSRAQAERGGKYLLNTNKLVRRQGRFTATAEGLPVETGDVLLLSHDILPRGVSGRVLFDPSIDNQGADYKRTHLPLDEPFTIGTSTVWLYIRDHRTDTTERAEVDRNATGQGDYGAGTVVTVKDGPHSSGGFTSVPDYGVTTYTLVEDGNELQVIATRTKRNEDLTTDIEWIQYDDGLFDDEASQTPDGDFFDGGLNAPGGPGNPANDSRDGGDTLIDGPSSINVDEVFTTERNVRRGELGVRWSWASDEAGRVAETRIYGRTPSETITAGRAYETSWELLGWARRGETTATVKLPPGVSYGTRYEIAVQGVTTKGVRRRPERCPRIEHVYSGIGTPPDGVSSLEFQSDGRRARFAWDRPTSDSGLVVELRRGGWILGDPVAQSSRSSTEYTEALSTAVSGAEFEVYAATRDTAGQYSARASLVPDAITRSVSSEAFSADYSETAWEDYADGWKTDSLPPTGDPVLFNLQRHADGYLYWSGSGLFASYSTWTYIGPTPTVPQSQTPQPVFLEASVEAEQVHPLTWTEASWSWGTPEGRRWSWEGPSWTVGSERNVTLRLDWRSTEDGTTWTDWQPFTPGAYEVVLAQFKVSLSRPSDSYDVRLRRLHTKIRYREAGVRDASQRDNLLRQEIL